MISKYNRYCFLKNILSGWLVKLVFSLFMLTVTSIAYSQCTATPGTEAIQNGTFELGDNSASTFGVLSRYDTRGGYSNPGQYTIWTNAHDFNGNNPVQVLDHTKKDGTGMFLMVDGPYTPGVCWQQDVNIFSNQTYYFSAWITSLYTSNFATLQFQVKGNNDATWTALGPLYQAPPPGVWQQIYQTWYSGTNTSASIRVVDSTQLANQWIWGNDYGLDDISFINSCQKVDAGAKPQLPSTISLCDHGGQVDLNTQITQIPQITFTWFKDASQLPNTTSILSNINQTGTYTVCVDSANCIHKDTVNVISNLKVDLGPDLNLCSPSYTYLSSNIANTTGLGLAWYKNDTIIQGEQGTSLFVSAPGEYKLKVTDLIGNNCNASDSVNVTSSAPIPNDATYCFSKGQTSATISVTGTGAFGWYDAATGGNKVGSGNSYNVTGLTGGDKTFYVKDTTTFNKTVFYSKPPDGNCGGGPSNSNNALNNTMLFTAKANFNINSIEFDLRSNTGNLPGSAGWGGNTMNLTLTDLTTNAIITKSVPIITSKLSQQDTFRINVGLTVVSGHNYSLQALGSGNVLGRVRVWGGGNTNCIIFPKDDGQIVFTGPGGGTNLSPGFYDWNISVGADCDRIPVRVLEQCPPSCVNPVSPAISPVNPIICGSGSQILTASCNNSSAATFLYTFYKKGTPDAIVQAASSNRQYTTSTAGTYYAVIADQFDVNTCNDTTPNAVVTIKSLPTAKAGNDTTICKTYNANLTASGGTAYSWSDGLGTASTVSVSPASDKIYNVTVSDANGCSATASVEVFVQACNCPSVDTKPVAPLCMYNAKISLDTITITTEPGTWTITSAPSGGSNPGTIAGNIFNAIGKDTGKYELTFTLNTAPTLSTCPKFSKQIVHVNSVPTANAGKNDSVCSGQTHVLTASATGAQSYTYKWSVNNSTGSLLTITPTATNTYTVAVQDNNGCTNAASVVTKVNPLPSPVFTASKNTVCPGDSTTIKVSGGISYHWQTGETADTIRVAPTSTQTYAVTLTNSFGCVKDTGKTINIFAVPSPQIIGASAICIGDTATLSVNGSDSYSWSTTKTGASITIFPTIQTTYQVTATNSNQCTGTDKLILKINSFPVANAGKNDSVCNGQSYVLTASATGAINYTYKWSVNNATGSMLTINPTATNTYTVTAIDNNGCKDTSHVVIKVNPLPNSSITASKSRICSGDSTTIKVSGGVSYHWLTGETTDTIRVAPVTNKMYSVTVRNIFGCSVVDTISIVVIQPPNAPNINDAVICTNNLVKQVLLVIKNPILNYIYEWYTASAGGIYFTKNNDITLLNLQHDTSFYIETITPEGCKSTDRKKVSVNFYDPPQTSFTYSPLVIYTDTPVLFTSTSSSDVVKYFWSFGIGEDVSDLQNPYYMFSDSGYFQVQLTVTNIHNCKASDSLELYVKQQPKIWIPSAFTPNGDSKNDILLVRGPVKSMNFEIYNQWGFRVFQTTKIDEGWDGKYNGIEQPEGNYLYILNCVDSAEKVINTQGMITLIR